MGVSGLTFVLAVALTSWNQNEGPISRTYINKQNETFERWWGAKLVWKFSDLPAEGCVPDFRIPYSGSIYPDLGGGTVAALRKYDRAFHGGRNLAAAHEQWDTTAFTEPTEERRGVFGLRRTTVDKVPRWSGHCNGWVAAGIRHAEPEHNVTHNGVTFTPADIKGLLAEIYMYRDCEVLGGLDEHTVHPGIFHVIIANWLGRGAHPIGMDMSPGREVWNFPNYAYSTASAKRSGSEVEVKMNLVHAMMTNGEPDKAPQLKRTLEFHYMLNLNQQGEIVGGRYLGDSAKIDLLWVPLHPINGRQQGNERGTPYVDVKNVLAIWRKSVPAELRQKWLNIDPTEEDRIPEEREKMKQQLTQAKKTAEPETSLEAGE